MKRLIVLVIFAAGVAMAAYGAWIPLKARLAQYLLERAWRVALDTKRPAPPWPWADTHPVARLSFPKEHDEVIVLAGASGRTMAFAPGHVDGTAMPGERGNCVITAHRDTHFSALRALRRGDEVVISDAQDRPHRYVVAETRVVDQSETSILDDTEDSRLTLITCWPFDAVVPGGRGRYVVVAKQSPSPDGRGAFLK